MEDEGMFMDGAEEEEDDEASDDEEVAGKKLKQSLNQAKTNALKNVSAAQGDSDEDDEESSSIKLES
jgi:hypothetical protein